MAADTISFTNAQINLPNGTTTGLTGVLTVDYTANTVTGNLQDTSGATYGNFSLSSNGVSYTLTGGNLLGLIANLSVSYPTTTPAPGSASVTYTSLLSLGGTATTNGVTVTGAAVPCFATGTLIRTARGDIAVENLEVGDLAITTSGAARPIQWIGHRKVDCRSHPRPLEVKPVRIASHAFGEERPARELVVSPAHSICVDIIGEVLIPAGSLVNGASIQQIDVDEVTYWHVELESHDIILAENLPAETYLDMGNRSFFRDADVINLLVGPDADPAQRTNADFCRPFYSDGPIVEALQIRMRRSAEMAGWAQINELNLHLEVDGHRIEPVIRGLTVRFSVPSDAKDIWLISPTARPCDVAVADDRRRLGLCIRGLRIEDGLSAARDIALSDPLLGVGFHEVEEDLWRWTAGRARLPAALWEGCENGFFLRVELAGMPVPRWTAPVREFAVSERLRLAAVA